MFDDISNVYITLQQSTRASRIISTSQNPFPTKMEEKQNSTHPIIHSLMKSRLKKKKKKLQWVLLIYNNEWFNIRKNLDVKSMQHTSEKGEQLLVLAHKFLLLSPLGGHSALSSYAPGNLSSKPVTGHSRDFFVQIRKRPETRKQQAMYQLTYTDNIQQEKCSNTWAERNKCTPFQLINFHF